MKEFMSDHKIINMLICIIVFGVSLFLVITGHKETGMSGLIQMLIGTFGIIGLLGYYNSFYK